MQFSSVVILEAARKCAKLAQVSSELAVSPPVRGKYVNCAKWKCTWMPWMPWMQLANTAALQKYLASTASQKYLVITALYKILVANTADLQKYLANTTAVQEIQFPFPLLRL